MNEKLNQFASIAKSKLEELNEQHRLAKTNLSKNMSTILIEAFKDVFETFPKLKTFGWIQYTPYFNDGDICEFHVRCDSYDGIRINGDTSYKWETIVIGKKEYKRKDWSTGQETIEYYDDTELAPDELWKKDAAVAISSIVSIIPEEILQDLYGEGEITVSKDGYVEVSDYDHE